MDTNREPRNVPQVQKKHPDEYEQDLNPNRMAGQNVGQQSTGADANVRTAAQLKALVSALPEFTMDELREIPILPEGERLQQGATYVDLRGIGRRPFTATGNQSVPPDAWMVPKKATPRAYWTRLVGIEEPENRG